MTLEDLIAENPKFHVDHTGQATSWMLHPDTLSYVDCHVGSGSNLVDKSENVLPDLSVQDLDLVLIDGQHAFPIPFIDWYYASRILRVGGRLIIDDTQLWTAGVLRDFMMSEPGWQIDGTFDRASAFIKTLETRDVSWTMQPYVVQRSALGEQNEPTFRRRLGSALRRRLGTHRPTRPC